MARTWTPEHVVSTGLARRLIHARFPDLRGVEVEPFGAGWDNTAFLAGGRLVFRFPRRAIAVELIRVEARVLPAIAPALPLAVPVPRRVGEPGLGYPWPFAGYELLPGRPASEVGLDSARREAAAPLLGRFLRTLHDRDTTGLDLPGDTIHRADMGRRLPDVRARIDQLVAGGLVADPRPLHRLIERLPERPPAAPSRLCHGDLYARHLLVDDDGLPAGVIDWGDVHLGSPAVDLAICHGFLSPAARPAFLAAYGPVDPDAWAFARLRALHYAVVLMLYGSEAGDRALLDEAAVSLANVLAE
jgi:aminoglycoside phosphotransferase (APT) family kinase protein